MICFQLFLSFFRIGLFGFGGGYAMIPLMRAEILEHHWLSLAEFADLVSISQMTPGPIAINAATFIGTRSAGVFGAISATLGVVLPSFLLILLIAHIVERFRSNRSVDAVIRGIRPASIGLIASAVLFFAELSVFKGSLGLSSIGRSLYTDLPVDLDFRIHPGGLGIFLGILILVKGFKLHPIAAVLLSALAGLVLF